MAYLQVCRQRKLRKRTRGRKKKEMGEGSEISKLLFTLWPCPNSTTQAASWTNFIRISRGETQASVFFSSSPSGSLCDGQDWEPLIQVPSKLQIRPLPEGSKLRLTIYWLHFWPPPPPTRPHPHKRGVFFFSAANLFRFTNIDCRAYPLPEAS